MNSERYSYGDLPEVGAHVASPSGRRYIVVKVFGSHKIECHPIFDGKPNPRQFHDFQANDLRKIPQPK